MKMIIFTFLPLLIMTGLKGQELYSGHNGVCDHCLDDQTNNYPFPGGIQDAGSEQSLQPVDSGQKADSL